MPPFGMVEYWNIGEMGLGILQYWIHSKIHIYVKFKIDNFLLKPTIPSFHYSIIP